MTLDRIGDAIEGLASSKDAIEEIAEAYWKVNRATSDRFTYVTDFEKHGMATFGKWGIGFVLTVLAVVAAYFK